MQRDFINMVAHELRTPVQAILGMTEIIGTALEGQVRGSVNAEDIDRIARNARRLEHLVRDILDLTRIERGSLQLRKSQFNIQDVIYL